MSLSREDAALIESAPALLSTVEAFSAAWIERELSKPKLSMSGLVLILLSIFAFGILLWVRSGCQVVGP